MSINELKSLIHNFVDNSENKHLLEAIYNLFTFSNSDTGQSIWQNLNDEQKDLILKAFEESEKEDNLLDHSIVMSQIQNEI
jgi:hypothetical protein